ncbi:ATP-grasp domain-containing protein [Pseudomonas sp. P8_241]|uniref:ATP-grasp domain-containing protein n=1 Tax=Pseudomonas sp. P8_241 TaxID=3043445 RepID=UPI002A3640BE|nr:ATP-grasp domain-containing protein [Pseudomonas sp. P8_241]WPN49454.1 ATP-grasp domain-containing protein [Pseudomonas sp. P8_241]
MKTILLCGNGLSGEVIPTIKTWGYKVALISEFPLDVGTSEADIFVEANSKDPEAALGAAKSLVESGVEINGVISLCWDTAISVATIAAELDLYSVSIASAMKATHKDLRSDAFRKHGVPSPKYAVVNSYEQLLQRIQEFEFPVILKPIDQSSSKGVIRVDSIGSLGFAYAHCKSFSDKKDIMLNEYLIGTEHSVEGLMVDGDFYLTAISDRVFHYEKYHPFFVEVGDVMPTFLPEKVKNELYEVTRDAALSLGLTRGVVKGDLVYSARKGVNVLEVAARLGGPRFGTEMVPLSNGTTILKAAIQQAVGDEINMDLLLPKFSKGMVNRSIALDPGVIQSISDVDSLKKCEGYYSFKWWGSELKVGDEIPPIQYGCGGVAYIIAVGSTRAKAIENADRIERRIKINTSQR